MMKRWTVLFLLTFTVSQFLIAQQEEEPPIPPKRSKAGKIGAFAGFTPGWLFVDVKPLNSMLEAAGAAPLKDDGVFLWGGGGAAYIMLLPNVRVGGVGMSGSSKSTLLNGFGVRKDAELHVGFGAVTLEYTIPLIERLDMSIGGMLGGGGIDIILRQDAGGNKNWNQEWNYFGSGNYQTAGQISEIKRTMGGSFFIWIPTLNFEYGILGWVGVRLGVSYVGMSAPSWTLDDTHDLVGVPSNINGKGWMINGGLFVGTF